ncbi:hypothetical protein [Caldisphaera sp.]|uniref:hypothetical protein n=1 Tax=Caldisphaera sp. TaxID=2060322 RepID=UPI0025C52191|nr:hypothetical protein [Caldisphaera sp.]
MFNEENLKKLKTITNEYIKKAYMLDEFVNRSLRSMRWEGIGILMVLDASFTSVGLNYFNAVIPAVIEFKEKFYDTNEIRSFNDIINYDIEKLRSVWKNERSWKAAKGISRVLSFYNGNTDREKLRNWASSNSLDNFKREDLSKVKGIGIITYQYLRIMGGIDTLMPDKIVIKLVNELTSKSGIILKSSHKDYINYIKETENIFRLIGVEPIKITWMSWLIDSEARKILSGKFNSVLHLI